MAKINPNLKKLQSKEPVDTTKVDKTILDDLSPKPSEISSRQRVFGLTEGSIYGTFDPDQITMKQRRLMRRDPMMALGLHYAVVPMVNASWTIECEDPQVAAFVENALKEIYTSLVFGLLDVGMAFGYAPAVIRFGLASPSWMYEDENGEKKPVWEDKTIKAVVWKTPRILDPEGAEVKFTEDGKFDGFTHSKYERNHIKADEPAYTVSAEHALWWTNEQERSFGDWYGYPRTGYGLRYWWSYWQRHLMGDRHFETDADPPVMVKYPPGVSPSPDDPTSMLDNADIALMIGTNIRDGATVAIPSDVYINEDDGKPTGTPKWDVTFLQGGENLAAFQASFEYLDVMKLRAILVPEQALVEGKGGTSSRNVAATYGSLFAESAAILMEDFDQLINDHLIPRLLQQNFTDPPSCRKVTTGFRDEDLSLVNDLIKLLMNVDPNSLELDAREMAKAAGLPQLKPGDKAAAVPSGKPENIDNILNSGGQDPNAQQNDPNAGTATLSLGLGPDEDNAVPYDTDGIEHLRDPELDPRPREMKKDVGGCVITLEFAKNPTFDKMVESATVSEDYIHCTLAFLSTEPLDAFSTLRVMDIVRSIASASSQLRGTIGGVGTLNKTSGIVSLNVPGIFDLRARLLKTLKLYDIEYSDEFDFIPHVTLNHDGFAPYEGLVHLPIYISAIALRNGADVTRVPFTGERRLELDRASWPTTDTGAFSDDAFLSEADMLEMEIQEIAREIIKAAVRGQGTP